MLKVALLRGINVGGHNKVPMARLRAFFEELGFKSVQTLLQSGNVVFDAGAKKSAALETLLEKESAVRLELEVDYIVRDAGEWAKVVKANPFSDVAEKEPGKLLVLFLRDKPSAAGLKDLQAAIKGREQVKAVGRELFIHYPDGMGRSKLDLALINRKLKQTGTGRNWNTVRKLADMLKA